MRKITAALVVLLLSLSGCKIIYKQDINQGNLLDKQLVDALKPGMSKRQVLLVMGSPSVKSPFHDDRWDYLTTLQRRGGKTESKDLTLYFEGGNLTKIEGDYFGKRDDELLRDARRVRGRQEDITVDSTPKSRQKDDKRGGG